jgi:transposase
MYEAMDLLHAHADEIEKAVFFQTADLLNLDVDLIFYDTTTCSFAIDDVDEDDEDGTVGLRKLGHSKEGTWTAQVVVALAVTRDGLPVRSWVLPGNTSDVTTIKRIRDDLRGWKLGRALFVADSGMNCADNREELARACGRYVLASRLSSVAEVRDSVLGRPGRYKELADNLRVKEVVVGEGEKRRRYIVCHNPKQAERQARHREQVLADLEEKLAGHPSHDASAKWAIELQASGRYGRYVTVGRGNKLRIDRAAAKAAKRTDGKWVLITNDDTLSVEDAATAYKALLVVERCFRSLKSTQIKMRPMFHWLPRRIEAHVKLCVLALLIERVVARDCERSWPRLREALDRVQATEFHTASHRFFRRNDLPDEAGKILAKLAIKPPRQVLAVEDLASEA